MRFTVTVKPSNAVSYVEGTYDTWREAVIVAAVYNRNSVSVPATREEEEEDGACRSVRVTFKAVISRA